MQIIRKKLSEQGNMVDMTLSLSNRYFIAVTCN